MPVALSEFAKYVRPDVPECPDILINDAILRAGIEFCKRTKIVKEEITITTVANQAKYELAVTDGMEPEEILEVKRPDADNLVPANFHDFKQWHLDRDTGQPNWYYLDDIELVLGMIPDGEEDLVVSVKLRPTDTATALPDELARRYKEKIAHGAKSILMMMAKKPWTDLQMAAFNEAKFQEAIDKAITRYSKGGAGKRLRTTGHYF